MEKFKIGYIGKQQKARETPYSLGRSHESKHFGNNRQEKQTFKWLNLNATENNNSIVNTASAKQTEPISKRPNKSIRPRWNDENPILKNINKTPCKCHCRCNSV